MENFAEYYYYYPSINVVSCSEPAVSSGGSVTEVWSAPTVTETLDPAFGQDTTCTVNDAYFDPLPSLFGSIFNKNEEVQAEDETFNNETLQTTKSNQKKTKMLELQNV